MSGYAIANPTYLIMNEANTSKNQEIICHCSGTTEATIKSLVLNNITDLEKISSKTGVCSGCGSCEDLVLDLIRMLQSHCAIL